MSRRKTVIKKAISPDSKYNSTLIAKFINLVMKGGKKSISESIIYYAMEISGNKLKENPLKIFQQVISNVRPTVEVCARRFGGATYQVPREASDKRSISLAMRWVINAAKQRKASSMKKKLSEEFCDAYNNRGVAIKMREDLHKLAAANKAFSHFRW
ncbi:MAG: 30S ribosomal protein S7 [Rickettsiaceae bacterium H1]|nr:30S ribosomal protein S7 [Rickettsiaceae bacterium H1]